MLADYDGWDVVVEPQIVNTQLGNFLGAAAGAQLHSSNTCNLVIAFETSGGNHIEFSIGEWLNQSSIPALIPNVEPREWIGAAESPFLRRLVHHSANSGDMSPGALGLDSRK